MHEFSMAASHSVELVPPTLALGILSSAPGGSTSALVSKRFAKRRHVQRTSWLTHASESGVVAHFVIRCLGLDDAAKRHVLVENATAGDMLCAPVNASEGRQKVSPKKCCRKHVMGGRYQLERPPITAPCTVQLQTHARGTDW